MENVAIAVFVAENSTRDAQVRRLTGPHERSALLRKERVWLVFVSHGRHTLKDSLGVRSFCGIGSIQVFKVNGLLIRSNRLLFPEKKPMTCLTCLTSRTTWSKVRQNPSKWSVKNFGAAKFISKCFERGCGHLSAKAVPMATKAWNKLNPAANKFVVDCKSQLRFWSSRDLEFW